MVRVEQAMGRPRARRKKRRVRLFLRRFVLFLFVFVCALGALRFVGPRAADMDREDLRAIRTMARQDTRLKAILDQPDAYPEALLGLLTRNPETADFVLGYPSHASDPVPESLTEPLDTVPLLLQWDARWGYQTYGSGMIAETGCGPTCLAMAAAYLRQDASITPYRVAQYAAQAGFYVSGTGTSWSLMTDGGREFGIAGTELPLDEGTIDNALDAGNLVICSMRPGDFTTAGHFIVLTGRTQDGYTVHDPNSRVRSAQTWTYDRLSGQISNLWKMQAA